MAIATAAALMGAIVALYYHRLGLTLSHYDARGHLIVARRVIDSMTPGWQQIGAVWLPLPQVINLLPVQIDAFYRTGASAVAVSTVAFAIASGAIASILLRVTESRVAAVLGAALFVLNPNVLYLQSTPMTEPLLLALTLVALDLLMRWCDARQGPRAAGDPASTGRPGLQSCTGIVFALACLTRYEAWPVTACALAAAAWARWRDGEPMPVAARRTGAIAIYPAAAILAFVIESRVVGGTWFSASGFFVPENKALDRPMLALAEIWWGARALTGTLTIVLAMVGFAGVLGIALFVRRRAASLIALSLAATAALPWAAFVKGHPFRIRYMVPLIAAQAIGAGAAAALVPSVAPITAALVALGIAADARPLSALAPMVLEAQWDRPNVAARQHVTDCLRANYDGETIMASMGSLGHYMQEMSRDGFALRSFLHEGNGDIWLAALAGPRRYAGWILIEEKAEGGDMLAILARQQASFLEGYERVCEGAGVALYRRTTAPSPRP